MPGRINLWTAAVALVGLATGCGQTKDKPKVPDSGGESKQVAVSPAKGLTAAKKPPITMAALPFKEAVLFEPPEGEQRPPDKTCAGKNVVALFEAIAGTDPTPGLWDKIPLVAADGKRLRYTAHVKTDLGTIDIELFSEAAPNHVRNFIALARAGYYNGLPFHRSLCGNVDGQKMAYLEGGCPLGTGEFGFGSVGYWLKPEISANLTHEEGTVGAVHGEAPESAACKFYICLKQASSMDGGYTIFGKITRGLDVAHAINKRPVVNDGELNDRPKEPVIMREVTIEADGDVAAIVAHNP